MEENLPAKNPEENLGEPRFAGKKIIFTVILLMLIAVGLEHWASLKKPVTNFQATVQGFISNQTQVSDVKKEVATPGALRSTEESNQAYLTRVGTINETNIQRQKNNLPSLKENSLLDKAALAKVKDMFAGQYFEHISPNGKGPGGLADDVGYDYIAIGENLALGNFKDDFVLVDAWMHSPGHRANILNGKYQEIGVAVLKGTFEGKTTWLAVQEFGKPASSCPVVNAGEKEQIHSIQAEADQLTLQINELKKYLDTTEPKTQEEVNAYNQKVTEFNNLVKLYNNKVDVLKQLTADYNSQVRAYNLCLGQ